MMRVKRHSQRREPTIALINIVFLMLVFFMVAGTLAQPLDKELKLVRTAELDGRAPPDTLVVHPDGRLSYRGQDIASPEAFYALQNPENQTTIRIVPDQNLKAKTLVQIAQTLRTQGAEKVLIITQRAIE